MPPHKRPATSGYAKLTQADEDEGRLSLEASDDEYDITTPLSTRYESIIPPGPRDGMRSSSTRNRPRHKRRNRSNSSGIDIKAINARLERWADEIASKFKINSVKGKSEKEERLEIHHTVFQPSEGTKPYTAPQLAELPVGGPDRFTRQDFEEITESIRIAIEMGIHPKMISQGSSGSYFARNTDGKVVGVFKPKDEEPYASRNPKWTKWIHRNLFPCFFGRACLIPNLSYVSEAAAYVLDERLRTNIVPYTDIVWFSSKSFYYDFWEKGGFWRRNKQLPSKVGSLQLFLKGYKDANIFLRENPWPDQNLEFRADLEDKRKRRPLSNCMPGIALSDNGSDSRIATPPIQDPTPRFAWTPTLKQAFREQLEKLVILDYIMRNTDRGLDNWMIKIDYESEEVSIIAEPPKQKQAPVDEEGNTVIAPQPLSVNPKPAPNISKPYRRYETMDSRSSTPQSNGKTPAIRIGAIDNSLSWPWKHPDAWRSFPFGWLFLPVSLIGQPFSQKTRDHFLPLLTSTAWWSETVPALRAVFAQDSDFQENMFARQMAVMKGQAWNVVETLKQADHGPLELTRRTRVCVWDDLVDIPIAVPMRGGSTEMFRQIPRKTVRINADPPTFHDDEDEMDIGLTHASAPSKTHAREPSRDLLDSPTAELPNPNRFDLTTVGDHDGSRRTSSDVGFDISHANTAGPSSPVQSESHREAQDALSHSITLPTRPDKKQKTRFSFDFPGRQKLTRSSSSQDHAQSRDTASGRRVRSGSTRTPSGVATRPGYDEYDEDDAGDLGYVAAREREGQMRKVIVERLEAVKSRRPVFTWC